ncbi:terminase small subunit [Paenibacillus pasadenensis]|uniref:terminase small subunit n=1 Tax=Paenibacillus pasadenensis TaxID=217090 RepID=UPI0005B930A9|nr:terminase small subunit [Paenibacillus pasadenensis]
MALTAKQKKFVAEYLVDLNATQAAIRAGYSKKTARSVGQENLTKPDIQRELQAAMSERARRTEITADMVLQRWWAIATADPNEIMHLRRLACRHCYGIGHAYQWRDAAEYEDAVRPAEREAELSDKPPDIPSCEGGFGFNRLSAPNPRCPICSGEGRLDLHLEDTRQLPPQARMLYAGVKQTQAGVEVKLQDQGKALENVARHLGMFRDRVELSGGLDNTSQDVGNLSPEQRRARIDELNRRRGIGTDRAPGS